MAQKRVATSTFLGARHPCPVICSIFSDESPTLCCCGPTAKSLHSSKPLLHFGIHLFLDFAQLLKSKFSCNMFFLNVIISAFTFIGSKGVQYNKTLSSSFKAGKTKKLGSLLLESGRKWCVGHPPGDQLDHWHQRC